MVGARASRIMVREPGPAPLGGSTGATEAAETAPPAPSAAVALGTPCMLAWSDLQVRQCVWDFEGLGAIFTEPC